MGRKLGKHKKACIVYGIWDCGGQLRYIGQTQQALETRMKYHKKSAFQTPGYFGEWLAGELKAKRKVEIGVLDDNATWNVSEILWIERKRNEGCDLLNVTRGGEDQFSHCQREGCIPEGYLKWKEEKRIAELKANDRQAEIYARALSLGIDPVQHFPAPKAALNTLSKGKTNDQRA